MQVGVQFGERFLHVREGYVPRSYEDSSSVEKRGPAVPVEKDEAKAVKGMPIENVLRRKFDVQGSSTGSGKILPYPGKLDIPSFIGNFRRNIFNLDGKFFRQIGEVFLNEVPLDPYERIAIHSIGRFYVAPVIRIRFDANGGPIGKVGIDEIVFEYVELTLRIVLFNGIEQGFVFFALFFEGN